MRCHICDARLTRVEIIADKRERGGYRPCKDCINRSTGRVSINDIVKHILGEDEMFVPGIGLSPKDEV